MPSERAYVSAGVSIPEPDCVVVTSTCDSVCIGRKRHASDQIRMPSESAYVSAGVSIPEPDGAVPTTTCDSVCIGRKRHAGDHNPYAR